jgi:hypothetical protein
VPRIALQKAEETFLAVRGKIVCVCACVHRHEFCHMSVLLARETKYYVSCFCLHNPPGSFLHLGVDIIYKVSEGKPERSILLWRPKYGWKNAIELDFKEIIWKGLYWVCEH